MCCGGDRWTAAWFQKKMCDCNLWQLKKTKIHSETFLDCLCKNKKSWYHLWRRFKSNHSSFSGSIQTVLYIGMFYYLIQMAERHESKSKCWVIRCVSSEVYCILLPVLPSCKIQMRLSCFSIHKIPHKHASSSSLPLFLSRSPVLLPCQTPWHQRRCSNDGSMMDLHGFTEMSA